MKFVTATMVLTTAAALVGLPAQGWSEEFFFPASWEGVWETTYTVYDCDTNEILEDDVDVDTICEGDSFEADFGAGELCTGMLTDTEVDLSCGFSEEVFPGCTVTFSYVTEATRSGDTVEGTATFSITYEGVCFLEDECEREEFTAQRLEEDPNCSGTATITSSWGVLKGRYR